MYYCCLLADSFPSFSQPSRTDEEDNDNEDDNSDDSSEAEDTAASSKSQDVSDILNDLFAEYPSLFITKENRALWFDKFMGDTQAGPGCRS